MIHRIQIPCDRCISWLNIISLYKALRDDHWYSCLFLAPSSLLLASQVSPEPYGMVVAKDHQAQRSTGGTLLGLPGVPGKSLPAVSP